MVAHQAFFNSLVCTPLPSPPLSSQDPHLQAKDEESDEEKERQLRRNRPGFHAGKALGEEGPPEPGSIAKTRTPRDIVDSINAGGAGGASATSEADAGLATVKSESWSLDQSNFDEWVHVCVCVWYCACAGLSR